MKSTEAEIRTAFWLFVLFVVEKSRFTLRLSHRP